MGVKTTIVMLLVMAGCAVASAQVFVPDNHFEAYLEANGYSDGVPNNDFVSSTVSTITILNISNQNIADLTGIASFTSLVELNCSNNLLTSMPFSSLSQNLEVLDFANNSVSSIVIPTTNNRPIREFRANGNLLTSLNASRLGSTLELLNCSNNNLTTLTLNNSGLQELYCDNNAFTSLDVSASPDLDFLSANGNELVTLDVTNNAVLQTLQVANNNLASLNLGANTELRNLSCQGNDLTSLDLGANSLLQALNAAGNQLDGFLDVSAKPSLVTFDVTLNPELECIEVDDAAAAAAASGQYTSWNKDAGATFSEDCVSLLAVADLAITKTDGVTSATPGGTLTYTIVASNLGPSTAIGVSVADTFPADLACSWTSLASGGAIGNTDGSGDLADTLAMPSGSSVTYTAVCDIDPAASGTLSNTATISSSITDPVPGNNSATDADTLLVPASEVIFQDDFELGNLSAWSATVPPIQMTAVFPAELEMARLDLEIDADEVGTTEIVGLTATGRPAWVLEVTRLGAGEVVLTLRTVSAEGTWTIADPVLVLGDRLDVHVEWRRAWRESIADGRLYLVVNGADVAWLLGLDNHELIVRRAVATGHLEGLSLR